MRRELFNSPVKHVHLFLSREDHLSQFFPPGYAAQYFLAHIAKASQNQPQILQSKKKVALFMAFWDKVVAQNLHLWTRCPKRSIEHVGAKRADVQKFLVERNAFKKFKHLYFHNRKDSNLVLVEKKENITPNYIIFEFQHCNSFP